MKKKEQPKPVGVVEELRMGMNNPQALITGLMLGAVVPFIVFMIVHHELTPTPLWRQPLAYVAAGGLLFSARSVFAWGCQAFGSPMLAAGFVACLEGAMVLSNSPTVIYMGLAYLVAINAAHKGAYMARIDRPAQARAAKRKAKKKEAAKPRAVKAVAA